MVDDTKETAFSGKQNEYTDNMTAASRSAQVLVRQSTSMAEGRWK